MKLSMDCLALLVATLCAGVVPAEVCPFVQSTPPVQTTPPVQKGPAGTTGQTQTAGPADGDGGAHQISVQPALVQPAQGGNTWFPKVSEDLGTYFTEEKATGRFTFQNPTDAEQRFSNIVASCACTQAVFTVGDRTYVLDKDPIANSLHRITKKDGQEVRERVAFLTVDAHQEGTVEVQMEMHGVRGSKEATLDIQISDSATPHTKLSWRATGAVFFEVTPPDVQLGEMTWQDKREFSFEISSPLREDFNITGHDPLAPGLTLTTEKTVRNGRAVWVVKGSYGPGVDERQNGAVIKFNTDLDNKQVEGRVVAFVKGPLTVDPGGFISFGHVPVGSAKSKQIRLTPTDDFVLEVVKYEFEDVKVPDGSLDKLVVVSKHEDKTLVVDFGIADGMPRAIIRGKLKLYLNHPAAPMKEFLFNGFVR